MSITHLPAVHYKLCREQGGAKSLLKINLDLKSCSAVCKVVVVCTDMGRILEGNRPVIKLQLCAKRSWSNSETGRACQAVFVGVPLISCRQNTRWGLSAGEAIVMPGWWVQECHPHPRIWWNLGSGRDSEEVRSQTPEVKATCSVCDDSLSCGVLQLCGCVLPSSGRTLYQLIRWILQRSVGFLLRSV